MKKKHLVVLTNAERDRLLKLIHSGEAPARMLNRARILLKADASEQARKGPAPGDDRQIARMLETSPAAVGRVRERFLRQGLDAALERSMPDRAYRRTFDGRAEARLVALACSEAPEGRDRWSMRLLADDRAVELGIVQSVSHETVRKALKKTSYCGPVSSRGG